MQPPQEIDVMKQSTETQQQTAAVDAVIQARQTKKIFADPASPPDIPEGFDASVWEAVELAGWAPFHYPVSPSHRITEDESVVPWRFYVLGHVACRTLIKQINRLAAEYADDRLWADAPTSKIPQMLAAAGAMVQVTWMPDPPIQNATATQKAERKKRNAEHAAAAAAAVQNLLLAATARGIDTYWSSGGVLRTEPVFDLLGIPYNQAFIGSVFLFPPSVSDNYVTGKLRDRRGPTESWARRIPQL